MANEDGVQSGDRILVLPLGRIEGRDGRNWMLTGEDADALAARIQNDGVDVPIDYEHGSYSGNGRAAGWLKDFRSDPEGLTAVIEFTPAGREAVDSREYRYLSPAFVTEGDRILGLESVGLTNMPNIASLPALNRREPAVNAVPAVPTAQTVQTVQSAELNSLRQANTELRTEVARLKDEMARRELNALLDRAVAEGRLAPAGREAALTLGLAARSDLIRLLEATPPHLNGLTAPVLRPDGTAPGLDETEARCCAMLGLSQAAFLACR